MNPLAFVSLRKFVASIAMPDLDLVWVTSEALTDLFPVVSARRKIIFTGVGGITLDDASVTLLSVTVSCC